GAPELPNLTLRPGDARVVGFAWAQITDSGLPAIPFRSYRIHGVLLSTNPSPAPSGDDDFRLGRDLATEPRIHRADRSGDLPPGRICKRHRDPHENRARNDCDALRPTVLRAVPRPRRSAPCRIQLIEMVGLCPTLDGRNPRPGPVPKRDVPLESKDGCGQPSRPRFAIRSRPVLPLGLHGSVPAICLPDRCRDVYRGRLHGLESFLDVPQDAIEQRFPVPVYRIAVGAPGPIAMPVPEGAAFRMCLHAKGVPGAVADRANAEGGPTG